MSTSTRAAALGSLATVVVTALLIGPALAGGGVLLYRDFVSVPDPALGAAAWGAEGGVPRAVPLDAAVALVAQVLGGGTTQRILLAAPLLLAGSGVAVLLRRRGAAAAVVGAVVAVWNPYVAERLGLGQPPTLLGYAVLPWLVVAATRRRAGPPGLAPDWFVTLAAAPASVTPFGGFVAAAAAGTLGVVYRGGRRGALLAVGPLLLCLPWVVAGLLASDPVGTPDGARAFAARGEAGDGVPAVIASVLGAGGVWTARAVPPSRHEVWTAVASLAVLGLAVAGAWVLRRADRRSFRLLAAAYVVPVAVVGLAATPAGIRLLGVVQEVPGAALLRDAHRLLGLSAMAVAVSCGVAAGRLHAPLSGAPRRRPAPGVARLAAGIAAAGCAGLAVLTVPDLPSWLWHGYRPVQMPADWTAAVDRVRQDPAPGVVSLPWQPLRATRWAHDEPFLDPLPRALPRGVLVSQDLVVRRGGRDLVVDRHDPAWTNGWLQGRVSAAALAGHGVRWVLEMRGTPGASLAAPSDLELVLDGPTTRLWRVVGPVAPRARPSRGAAVVLAAAWVAYAAVLAGAVVAAGRACVTAVRRDGRQDVRRHVRAP